MGLCEDTRRLMNFHRGALCPNHHYTLYRERQQGMSDYATLIRPTRLRGFSKTGKTGFPIDPFLAWIPDQVEEASGQASGMTEGDGEDD